MQTIAEMYAEWWKSVAPAGCSDPQRTEMRRAFYCGCYAVFTELTGQMADPTVADDAGCAHLTRLDAELKAFFGQLAAGRA